MVSILLPGLVTVNPRVNWLGIELACLDCEIHTKSRANGAIGGE
jgi:hypothetical protein